MEMKRTEFLKFYVLSLLAEGHFKATDLPHVMLAKVGEMVTKDFPIVAKEVGTLAVQSGLRNVAKKAGTIVGPKLEELANKVGEIGIGGLWDRVMDVYASGRDAKARR